MKTFIRIIAACGMTVFFFSALVGLLGLMHHFKTFGNILGIIGAISCVGFIFCLMYFGALGDKKP